LRCRFGGRSGFAGAAVSNPFSGRLPLNWKTRMQ
jgi:hypothetical protein